ncbi:hypothetical protein [Acidovorax phage ACPWH]|nr:hypothetical protein [Acidovorax phage ACPWH]
MPAARYWRVSGAAAYAGGDLELSELHLCSGSGDASFNNVVLLVQGAGADGSTAFTDKSLSAKTLVPAGDVQNSETEKRFGNPSVRFDGTGDYIIGPKSADFAFGTGDFTVEAHVFQEVRTADVILVSLRDAASGIFSGPVRISSAGKVGLSDGSSWRETTDSVPVGAWSHVAVSRAGGTLRIFIDGVVGYTTTDPLDFSGARLLYIGAYEAYGGNPAGGFFQGYLDQIRITKGVGRYNTNFNPPPSPFATSTTVSYIRADEAATMICTGNPLTGTVADLRDEDTSSFARFSPRNSGFAFVWDFGAGQTADIAMVHPGSTTSRDRFLSHCDLHYSTDGSTWTVLAKIGRFNWPGPYQMADLTTFSGIPVGAVGVGQSMVVASDPPDGPVRARLIDGPHRLRDIYFAGRGFIAGTVKEKNTPSNVPLRRRVRLYRDRDGLLISETWSDRATGEYRFDEIDETERYTTVAYDHLHNYRAVLADNLTPEIMS